MPHSDPTTVQVFSSPDCPASKATVEKLTMLGVPVTVAPIKECRAFMARQRYTMSPVCILWLGEGKRRVAYTSWQGHKPKMLELAARVGKGEG